MRMRAATVLALAIAALPLGACGGEDDAPSTAPTAKDQYIEQVKAGLQPTIDASSELANSATGATSEAELVQPLADAERAYGETAQKLSEIQPPPDVADLHARLIDAQQKAVDATTAAREDAERGSTAGIQQFQRAGQEYEQELTRLDQEFRDKGYDISGP